METKDILKKLMSERKITAYRLAKECPEVNQPTIQRILSGESKKPLEKTLQAIADYFGISVAFLMGLENESSKQELEDRYEFIPKYNACGALGPGIQNGDHVEISGSHAYQRKWLKSKGLIPENLCVIGAKGDSMDPTIMDGDVVLVDRSDIKIKNGQVYVLAVPNDGVRIKRLFLQLDGSLKISSDNKNSSEYLDEIYRPGEIEQINIIGRVVHRSGGVN